MALFFVNSELKDNTVCFLENDDVKHCTKVLRKNIGDTVELINGNGNFYKGIINTIEKNKVEVFIEEIIGTQPNEAMVHIAVAPVKNISRIEWFLEKAVEIGIDEISFFSSFHSERKNINLNRLEKIVVSAMKQSQKAKKPVLKDIVPLNTLIKKLTNNDIQKFIAYQDNKNNLLSKVYMPNKPAIVVIGPEGDFADNEKKLLLENNYKPVLLGKHRLRTETAALVSCHTIRVINDYKNILD